MSSIACSSFLLTTRTESDRFSLIFFSKPSEISRWDMGFMSGSVSLIEGMRQFMLPQDWPGKLPLTPIWSQSAVSSS